MDPLPFASQCPPKTLSLRAPYALHTITVRKLSGLQFQAARTERPPDVTFRQAVLRAGIVAWSFDAPVSQATIDDLDEDVAEYVASEIILVTKPSLQQTAEQAEEARKNG